MKNSIKQTTVTNNMLKMLEVMLTSLSKNTKLPIIQKCILTEKMRM